MTTPPNPNSQPPEDAIRPHTYDGIQEYDKRLPNWWLLTFYGAIAFAIVYWAYYAHSSLAPKATAQVDAEISRIQAARLSASTGTINDDTLWQMSRNANIVTSGETTFKTTCMSCHGEKLTGGIGPNLVDRVWIHGGRPTDILSTVTNGVAIKGMPTWGPVLGPKKIAEVVAFIVSKHEQTEPEMNAGSGHASVP